MQLTIFSSDLNQVTAVQSFFCISNIVSQAAAPIMHQEIITECRHIKTASTQRNKQWVKLCKAALKSMANRLKCLKSRAKVKFQQIKGSTLVTDQYTIYYESFKAEKFHIFCALCMSAKLFNIKVQDGAFQIWI